MSELVEQVARALHRAHYERGRRLYPTSAWDQLDRFEREAWLYSSRAALAAMRELPDSLYEDGAALAPDVIGYDCSPETYWQAIIDAALTPPVTPPDAQ